MSTTLVYNGVTMTYCETMRFDQTCEYDESGTDLLYHKFNIVVRGLVHADSTHFANTFPGNQTQYPTAADLHRAIEATLMHPRGNFRYSLGSTPLVMATGDPSRASDELPLDVENGPKPRALRITHVAGTKVLRVEFEIDVCIVRCGAPNAAQGQATFGAGTSNYVLNNRWSLEETKDEHFYTRRVWEGLLRVSHSSFWPHVFRWLCVPGLSHGYRRASMRFVQSTDGLSLRYTVIDEQKFRAPIPPAVDWNATYSETIMPEQGFMGFSAVDVWMIGGPGTNQRELFAACLWVVWARIATLNKMWIAGAGQESAASFPISVQFIASEHENRVECRVVFKHTSSQESVWNNATAQIGIPLAGIPNYNPYIWPIPIVYDSSTPIGMFATYLQSPCVDVHGIVGPTNIAPQSTKPERVPQDPPERDDNEAHPGSPQVQDPTKGITDQQEHLHYPYTFLDIDNSYDRVHGLVQLPYSSASTDVTKPTCAVARLHAPICRRILTIVAERIGSWPQLPKPVDTVDHNGIKEFLLEDRVLLEVPQLMPDGVHQKFRAQAKYVYAMERPPQLGEALRAASSPQDKSTPQHNVFLGLLFFMDNLLEFHQDPAPAKPQ